MRLFLTHIFCFAIWTFIYRWEEKINKTSELTNRRTSYCFQWNNDGSDVSLAASKILIGKHLIHTFNQIDFVHHTWSVWLRLHFSLILVSIACNKIHFFFWLQTNLPPFFRSYRILCKHRGAPKKKRPTNLDQQSHWSHCLPSLVNLRLWISIEIKSCCDRNALT